MNNNEVFKKFFGVPPTNRTSVHIESLPIDSANMVPNLINTYSYDDINALISERASELASKYKDKKIYLLWSGGVDSTTAFYSMLKTGISFKVVCDDNSRLEYPKLHNDILNLYKIETIHPHDYESINKNSVSATMFRYTDEQRKENASKIIPSKIYKNYSKAIYSVLNRHDDLNLSEYLWALNFIFKYTNVINRMKQRPYLSGYNFEHFFNTDKFQMWAIQNYKQFTSFNNPTEYKPHLKSYIYSQNSDEMYFKYKTKIPSLQDATFLKERAPIYPAKFK